MKKVAVEQACKKLFIDDAAYKAVGKQFRERRLELNLTVAKAVRISGVRSSTLKNIERGTPFSISSLILLLDAYGMEAEAVLPPLGGPVEALPSAIPQRNATNMARFAEKLNGISDTLRDLALTLENISRSAKGEPEVSEAFVPGERKNNIIGTETLAVTQLFGSRVQALRIARGLPIHQLSITSTVGEGAVIAIEAGIRNPSLFTAYELAEALKIECSFLFSNRPAAKAAHAALQLRAASTTASRHRETIGDLLVACERIYDVIDGSRST